MGGDMLDVFDFSRNKWLVSVTMACAVCTATPICATDLAPDEIQNQCCSMDPGDLIAKFDKLEGAFEMASIPIEEGRKFLESFIIEINAKHGLSLTLQDACRLVRENIHILQIPHEMQEVLLSIGAALESCPSHLDPAFGNVRQSNGLYWPNEWNWFGLNKKNIKTRPVDITMKSLNLNRRGWKPICQAIAT